QLGGRFLKVTCLPYLMLPPGTSSPSTSTGTGAPILPHSDFIIGKPGCADIFGWPGKTASDPPATTPDHSLSSTSLTFVATRLFCSTSWTVISTTSPFVVGGTCSAAAGPGFGQAMEFGLSRTLSVAWSRM